MESVHDNWVYAHAVDYERRLVVLHSVYPHTDPQEFTDIVFVGVIAHHIEQQGFHGDGMPGNVLFDVEESEPAFILRHYANLLAATKNYAWPVLNYDSLDDLAVRLTVGGAKCFEVHSSCGLCGFVFASSMEFRRRASRAQPTDA